MKAIAAVLLALLLIPAAASAHQRTIAPPGNSGVNQYVEVVPTAGGGRPSGTIPGGETGGSDHSGTLSPGTRRALARGGLDGRGVAALATATAPTAAGSSGSGPSRGSDGRGSHGHGSAAGKAGNPVPASAGSSMSPLVTLGRAITGASTPGGLGPLLPVILAVIAVGGAALALRRRRDALRHRRAA